ncbi:tRNA guanosine(34) transglycosylase Tgt [Patescibacteria group bacterium]|nr:MAG: tRNA guanosine(34) transglycosylase Tgt [Patescibacteria group bacterium]
MFFETFHQDKNSRARTGVIHTEHGDIETPSFMPVGTQATVKSLDSFDLRDLNAQIILGNTYHLHLRPGEDIVAKLGGLHKFMNWDRPMLTDSGGFQVFSLGKQIPPLLGEGQGVEFRKERLAKIDKDGVTFKSHIDGSTHRFTPESSIKIQHKLDADIIMAFDECAPDNVDAKYAREAMERTHRWAKRCLEYHLSSPPLYKGRVREGYRQHLFGIVQGSNHRDLREESARHISAMDFDGIAVGGESIGYNMSATKEILDWVYPLLPPDKPHYSMGLGLSPLDIFEVVERGIDMFDCVAPTRLARHGMLFLPPLNKGRAGEGYRINITNSRFASDAKPIDKNCACHTCQHYSRAYLRHLFNAGELSAMRLATIHNLHFFLDLMKQIRAAIAEDKFLKLKKEWQSYAKN